MASRIAWIARVAASAALFAPGIGHAAGALAQGGVAQGQAVSGAAAPGGAGLIVERNRADRAPAILPPKAAAPIGGGRAAAPVQAFAPFVIHEVRVEGASVAPARVGDATRPFIGRLVDVKSIDALPEAVAKVYAGTDVALYTIALPQQTFADGVVRLVAIEGRVAGVAVHGPVRASAQRLVRAYAQRLTRDRPLKRSHLQRVMLLIGALPGVKVDAQFLPGRRTGEVELSLGVTQKRAELGLGINDRGQNLLGRTQLEADLTLNALLRQGERTVLTFATPTDVARFQYYGLSHTEALGDDGLTFTGALAYLRTRPRGSRVQGEAEVASLSMAYPIWLAPNRTLTGTLSLDGLNSSNALLGQTLTDERTRVLRGALAFAGSKGPTTLSGSGAVSHGLDALGARVLAPGYDALNFTKLSAQARVERTFGRWAVRLHATAQYSSDLLPASEQLALGGDDFGRAFPAALVTGDEGAAGSAEVGRTFKTPGPFLNSAELYGFIDGGRVRLRSRPQLSLPGRTYDLSSTGVGVRLSVAKRAVFDLEGARALQTPDVPGAAGDWRLIFAYRTLY